MSERARPLVGVVMGSESDWEVMQHTADTLKELRVPHTCDIASAHRMAEVMRLYALETHHRLRVVVAGAGGSAALPGMIEAFGEDLTVIGVATSDGPAAVYSMIEMPSEAPLLYAGQGKKGAINAAIAAARIVGAEVLDIKKALAQRREGVRAKGEEARIRMQARSYLL